MLQYFGLVLIFYGSPYHTVGEARILAAPPYIAQLSPARDADAQLCSRAGGARRNYGRHGSCPRGVHGLQFEIGSEHTLIRRLSAQKKHENAFHIASPARPWPFSARALDSLRGKSALGVTAAPQLDPGEFPNAGRDVLIYRAPVRLGTP